MELVNKNESKIPNLDVQTDEIEVQELIALQTNQVEYGLNPWIRLNLLLDTFSKFSFSDKCFIIEFQPKFLKYTKWEINNCFAWKTGMQKWLHSFDNSLRGGYKLSWIFKR